MLEGFQVVRTVIVDVFVVLNKPARHLAAADAACDGRADCWMVIGQHESGTPTFGRREGQGFKKERRQAPQHDLCNPVEEADVAPLLMFADIVHETSDKKVWIAEPVGPERVVDAEKMVPIVWGQPKECLALRGGHKFQRGFTSFGRN